MELDDDSDLSSSSSSYSSVGEESVGEEEDDDSEDEAPPGPKGAERGDQGRRKRKRKLAGRRREIRTKYESVKDFNPEARSAQTEEIERIRRLELQRTLQAANPSAARVAGATDDAAEGSALLGRSPVFRNLAEDEKRERVEAIVISSDSEDEEDVQRAVGGGVVVNRTKMTEGGREEGGEEERRGGRYDVVGEGEGEQVIVNLGHLPEEEDVELPPQIARIIKPHQVGVGVGGGGGEGEREGELVHVHVRVAYVCIERCAHVQCTLYMCIDVQGHFDIPYQKRELHVHVQMYMYVYQLIGRCTHVHVHVHCCTRGFLILPYQTIWHHIST